MADTARILVVDDERALRRALNNSLTAAGYEIEEAGSGEKALEMLDQTPFDMVLLDVNMPGISGVETCSRLRADGKSVAIVIVTVRDSETDIVQALGAGADDYVVKPFRLAELLARVRAVLRRVRAEVAVNAPFRVGALRIDFERRTVSKNGVDLHLSPKEFDLLAFLAQHAGVPLPHAKILRAVWGPEHGDESEYLRTYIRLLRKKLEDPGDKPQYIITEPWFGYRFMDPAVVGE